MGIGKSEFVAKTQFLGVLLLQKLSFKYLMSMTLSFKDIGIGKSEFVA